MDDKISEELSIYLNKIEINSVRESWVYDNLKNLYIYIKDKDGDTISEKIYLINNKKSYCKICNNNVKFLSYKRGYRIYCSKKCSNNDNDLTNQKKESLFKNNMIKHGVSNTSKLESTKIKIKESKKNLDYDSISKKNKETCIKKYGVDNISKLEVIKKKKENTTLVNYGVDNPFKSDIIKNKIKETSNNKWGVDSYTKTEDFVRKTKLSNLEKYGVDNFTKTEEYRNLMYEKYRSSSIKTNLNSDDNYIEYLGKGKHLIKCVSNEHCYETNSHLYHSRLKLDNKQCTVCYPINKTSSFKEKEIFEYIISVYDGPIEQSHRDGLEIDIYLPELKIGIEFNGLYWHSELFKEKNYHLDKTKYFKEKDIRIIHIWEDDWDFKKDIIKSQINKGSITKNKIFARKCVIKEVNNILEYKEFLDKSHIQGYTSASIKIGLYYDDELVSLMTFDHFEGRKSMLNNEWNLSRFCNKLNVNVIGGASRLLKYFIKNYKTKRIISFSDLSWSVGDLYYKLGFYVKSTSYPNYSYLIDKKRSNKQKWKKSNLIKMGFDSNLSESKIMEDNFGAYKIFDCGQIKFEIII